MTPRPFGELVDRWLGLANQYEQDHASVAGALMLRRLAREVEAAWLEWWTAPLEIEAAAGECGYSADRLRELAREGALWHTRTGRRILLRRCDLPRHPIPPEQPAVNSMAAKLRVAR